MPRLVITEGAVIGLERCRKFLFEKNPMVSTKASQIIKHYLNLLMTGPEIGKPLDDMPELRELIIPFGESGYVALYKFDNYADTVYLLAFRHQKEAGY
ncbi:MAG: type II toxin-antitoxin system RelE/ParE family toxin [Gammaproteobacteria bacterium]|nr:type II toxin-antitoxin system RelE/ParE family toxin [Gammaproteobacteria bacterium]